MPQKTLLIAPDGLGVLPTTVWETVRQDRRTLNALSKDLRVLRFYEGAELLKSTTEGVYELPKNVTHYEVLG